MKNKTKLPDIFLALIFCFMYLPLILIVIYSFNQSKISSVWDGFSLKWYQELFADKALFQSLANSLILGLASSFSAGIIGTLGAFGMSKVKTKTGSVMEYISLLPIMIPEIILAMVFMVFFSLIGLPFGMTTLIVAHTAFCIPYVYMLVRARLVGMDPSLSEAALDLGATKKRVFLDIVLPLISPAIASGMLLSFMMSFDDVIISIFVTGLNTNTLPIKIYTQLKTGVTPKTNALCALMLVFSLTLFGLAALISRKNKVKKI